MFFLSHKTMYPVALSALLGMALPAVAATTGSETITSVVTVSADDPDVCVTTITAPKGGTAIDVTFDSDKLDANNKGALSPAGSDTAPRYISIAASGGDSCTISGLKVDTKVTTGAASPISDSTGVASIQAVGSEGGHWLMAPIVAHMKSVQVPLDGSKPAGETARTVSITDGTQSFTYTSGEGMDEPLYSGISVAGISAASSPYFTTQAIGNITAPMARQGTSGALTLTPEVKYAFKSADIGVGMVMAALPWNDKNVADKNAVANGDTANIGFTVTVTEM